MLKLSAPLLFLGTCLTGPAAGQSSNKRRIICKDEMMREPSASRLMGFRPRLR